jgi:hypothetical protein
MYYMIIKLRNGLTIVAQSVEAEVAEEFVKESLNQPFPDQYEIEHIIKGVEIDYQQLKFTASVERNTDDYSNKGAGVSSMLDDTSVPDPQLKLDL